MAKLGRPVESCSAPDCDKLNEVYITIRIRSNDKVSLDSISHTQSYCFDHGEAMYNDLSERLLHHEALLTP